jgi:hypothetical protein
MSTDDIDINMITLRSGFVDDLRKTDSCPEIMFSAPNIPPDIIKQFQQDDYLSLKSSYGDPSWGEPIQYDRIEIKTTAGTKTLEIFNRAILLFTQNTEETRRAHRVIYAVEKYMPHR